MDCARYIRKPVVLAGWLITPLFLFVFIIATSFIFRQQTRLMLQRNIALEQTIPMMHLELSRFDQFLQTYLASNQSGLPAEDAHISILNTAAEAADFTISGIRITQETVNKTDHTSQMNIHAEGTGNAQSITAFLNNIKAHDRFVFEDVISIARSTKGDSRLTAEINLCKIYPAPESETP